MGFILDGVAGIEDCGVWFVEEMVWSMRSEAEVAVGKDVVVVVGLLF